MGGGGEGGRGKDGLARGEFGVRAIKQKHSSVTPHWIVP